MRKDTIPENTLPGSIILCKKEETHTPMCFGEDGELTDDPEYVAYIRRLYAKLPYERFYERFWWLPVAVTLLVLVAAAIGRFIA